MKQVLVTGSLGFLGRNLIAHLSQRADCQLTGVDREESDEALKTALLKADIIFHLAGVNRPADPEEFERGNADFTEYLCRFLSANRRSPKVVFSSSVQAALYTPYGVSKARAESVLLRYATETGAVVRIYRLKNIFGKWAKPNYNSVVATFCYNIANDIPITVSDNSRVIDLVYVDDVVARFCKEIDEEEQTCEDACLRIPTCTIRLGDLAGRIQAFHEMRTSEILPDFADRFSRALYATYLSYVPSGERQYALNAKSDVRGSLAEVLKQESMGQIFISRTRPNVTRGNHYHHTKTEKFLVVEGTGLIRMRSIKGGPVEEYAVDGESFKVVDIPPGMTHSITNRGNGDMVALFWASEIFDPDRPDTYFLLVDFERDLTSDLTRCR